MSDEGRARLQSRFVELYDVMARLRRDCPWDREQTHASLRRFLLEETYEVLEALDAGDVAELRGELGDLMFQIWFHAEVAAEHDAGFDLADVLESITAKLRRRHPHVFADVQADDAETVARNWEQLKMSEGRDSVLDGVPATLPALAAAEAIQEKASAVGFDWTEIKDVAAKVREETEELAREIEAGSPRDRLTHELGDLLFSLTNLGRHLDVGAEDCLRAANARFSRRFRHVEGGARASGRKLSAMTLDEMDALWEQAKREE